MNNREYEVVKIECNVCNEKLMILIFDNSEKIECYKCKSKVKIKECETWSFNPIIE